MDPQIVERIIKWNYKRNQLNFDPSLEVKMLSEEAREFYEAVALGDSAHILAEWADFHFVSYGTYAKYHAQPIESIVMFEVGVEKWEKLDAWIYNTSEQLDTILDGHFANMQTGQTVRSGGLNIVQGNGGSLRHMKQVALETVTECNEAKGTRKNPDGKIEKGPKHQDPVELIRERLNLN
jgi:hypothetical protein